MQYTRLHASRLLATALGSVSEQVALWLCGWSAHEIQCGIGCDHPQNNLWASGEKLPGSTNWNGIVQNYPTLAEAITAMVINLHESRYAHLLSAIAASNVDALLHSSDVQAALATWCGSQCYSKETASFISDGQAHANDLFDDAAVGNTNAQATTACKQCPLWEPFFTCPDGYFCAADTSAPPGWGCCKPNSEKGSGIGIVSDALSGLLPDWLTHPDWPRVAKFVLGLIALGFGLLLIFSIISGKVESNPAVQTATKAVALV
jgi:hypothetical protein